MKKEELIKQYEKETKMLCIECGRIEHKLNNKTENNDIIKYLIENLKEYETKIWCYRQFIKDLKHIK
jgi:hypothetical protein